jgi:hypothetical protein
MMEFHADLPANLAHIQDRAVLRRKAMAKASGLLHLAPFYWNAVDDIPVYLIAKFYCAELDQFQHKEHSKCKVTYPPADRGSKKAPGIDRQWCL